jgi:hypothetical protein
VLPREENEEMKRSCIFQASYLLLPVALTALAACGTGAAIGAAQPVGAEASAVERGGLPTLPSPTLAVPDGNELESSVYATGSQIYPCAATASGFAWGPSTPSANLYQTEGHERDLVGKHFGGPTWQWLDDGSTVKGQKVTAFTPDPTAIPWLLLVAVAHTGTGHLSTVSYVQRLQTTGGLAPTTGCDATTVGTTVAVSYTARYYFYVPKD